MDQSNAPAANPDVHHETSDVNIRAIFGFAAGLAVVAILIHLLNPEQIILSGRGSAIGKVWLAPIQQAINEHCIPKISENTEVHISSLGYQAELIGAAALVMEHYDRIDFSQHKNRQTKQPA